MSKCFYESLSSDEKEVFDLYKGNNPFRSQMCFADYLNESLRKKNSLEKEWEDKAQILDRVVRKYSCEKAIVLYRATFDDFVLPFVSRDDYIYPAYMSTCTDPIAIKRHYANTDKTRIPVRLTIECHKGTYMIPMESNPSFGGHEREMLLGRSGHFGILSRRETDDRAEMNFIMSTFYAKDYCQLKEYNLQFLEYA